MSLRNTSIHLPQEGEGKQPDPDGIWADTFHCICAAGVLKQDFGNTKSSGYQAEKMDGLRH